MKTQDIFIARPSSAEQVSALKAFMHALKIKFEISKEGVYNPEFVNKISESKEQVKNGKVTRVKKEGIKEFLGL